MSNLGINRVGNFRRNQFRLRLGHSRRCSTRTNYQHHHKLIKDAQVNQIVNLQQPTMPPKSSKKVTSNTQVEEENDENVPPQGRRSGRVKGRKSASTEEIGIPRLSSQ
jgi:hypothetical protein